MARENIEMHFMYMKVHGHRVKILKVITAKSQTYKYFKKSLSICLIIFYLAEVLLSLSWNEVI